MCETKSGIIIKDNFFKNPTQVRKFLISLDYYPPTINDGWRGFRTLSLSSIDEKFNKELKKDISEILGKDLNEKKFFSYAHYATEKTKKYCFPNFYEYGIHTDNCQYAGIIYLDENAPNNCGTSFFDENKSIIFSVDNIFNRAIVYNSNIYHRPTDLYGNHIYDSRLTINFFIL